MLKCRSAGRVVYHVFGSAGFVSDEYFVDGAGNLIATFQDTDDRGPGYKGPPVSVSDCKTLRKSN